MSRPLADPVFDIGRDLQRAYEEGYKQGRYDEMVETEMSLPEWIPVSERLPKEDGYYLVTWEDEDGRCTLCDYYRVQFGFGKCVKAWMPLPEPYKGGEEE